MRTVKYLASVLLLTLFFYGCYYDKAELIYPTGTSNCDTANMRLSVEINSILNNNCNACHGGTAAAGGGIQLQNYNSLKALASGGTLYTAISHTGSASPMPKGGGKLSDCDISKIKAWIDRGAPNN